MFVLAVLGLLLDASTARADSVTYGGEAYQRKLLDSARAENGLQYDPHPEGKIIERIVTVPYGVILPDEPYPNFLNWLHVTTLPEVVERELLFQPGSPWSNDQVEESARNLRNYLFLTSARIVACKGSAPDKVVALVVTKDLWSLRPNTNFSFVGSNLELLQAEITEENLAGRMKRTTADFGFDLATFYAGQQFQDPRLLGSEVKLSERGDLIWNRTSGVLEGGVANFSIQQPLYTLDTPWAWGGSIQYRQDIYRLFSSGTLVEFVSPTTGEELPYEMNRHLIDLNVGLTRSLGHAHKRDFSVGYRAFVHDFGVPAPSPPVQPATLADFYSTVVPRSESAGMLYVSFHSYEADYRELLDIQTFALSEDYRLGLNYTLEARFATPEFGFSSTFIEPLFSAAWTTYSRGDLFAVSASLDTRYQPEIDSSNPWVDGLFTATVYNVSPLCSFFRLHTSLRYGRRFNDFNHGFTTLGGDTSLRGYPSAYLIGANFWAGNAEARTLPVSLATLHAGLAAFFDAGGASDYIGSLGAHGSVGAGIRIGFPQFNRDVLRVDFGLPLEAIQGATPAYIVAQFGQAF